MKKKIFIISDLHLNFDLIEKTNPPFETRSLEDEQTLLEFKRKTFDMSQFGKEWDNYKERLEKEWDSIVGNDDIVIIPGDISAASKQPIHDFEWIEKRKGTKIIGCGNHDKWWPKKGTQRTSIMQKYKSIILVDVTNDYIDDSIAILGTRFCDTNYNVWPILDNDLNEKELIVKIDETCCKVMEERIEKLIQKIEKIPSEKITILMLHHPPYNEKGEMNPLVEKIVSSKVKYCLFGHIHNLGKCYFHKEFTSLQDIQKRYPSIDLTIGETRFICCSSDLLQFKPLELY